MSSNDPIVKQAYATDGATVAFDTAFDFDSASDLRVYTISSDAHVLLFQLNSGYTVSGGGGAAGTVTMSVPPADQGVLLIVRKGPSELDQYDYLNTTDSDETVADQADLHYDKQGLFLTIADAAATYLTIVNAALTYLTIADAAATYVPLTSVPSLFNAHVMPPGMDGEDAEWAIPGAPGAPGVAGPAGADGGNTSPVPGMDGEDAAEWMLPGSAGGAGSAGADGATGPAGPIGPNGYDGEDGDALMFPPEREKPERLEMGKYQFGFSSAGGTTNNLNLSGSTTANFTITNDPSTSTVTLKGGASAGTGLLISNTEGISLTDTSSRGFLTDNGLHTAVMQAGTVLLTLTDGGAAQLLGGSGFNTSISILTGGNIDLTPGSASGALTIRSSAGSPGQVLTTRGVGQSPVWAYPPPAPILPGMDGEDVTEWMLPGSPGAVGTGGATGATGQIGPNGMDGDDVLEWMIPGAVGGAGATGATGATGQIGPNGMDGDDVVEWMLPGSPGVAGADGAPGANGVAGINGMDGEDSLDLFVPGPAGTSGTGSTPEMASTSYEPVASLTLPVNSITFMDGESLQLDAGVNVTLAAGAILDIGAHPYNLQQGTQRTLRQNVSLAADYSLSVARYFALSVFNLTLAYGADLLIT